MPFLKRTFTKLSCARVKKLNKVTEFFASNFANEETKRLTKLPFKGQRTSSLPFTAFSDLLGISSKFCEKFIFVSLDRSEKYVNSSDSRFGAEYFDEKMA